MISTPMIVVMIATLMTAWFLLHSMAHAIVEQFGLVGGLVACAVIYGTGLIMDRY